MINETVELNGRTFNVTIEPDDTFREPWIEDSGHGIVSEWRSADYAGNIPKTSGERVLYRENRYPGAGLVYDWAGTMKRAKADGWGLSPDARAALVARLGREPSPGEVAAEAVQRDFDRLRAWCAGEWCYVGVVVTDPDTDESASVWGVESDCEGYINEVAADLVHELQEPEFCEHCGQVKK